MVPQTNCARRFESDRLVGDAHSPGTSEVSVSGMREIQLLSLAADVTSQWIQDGPRKEDALRPTSLQLRLADGKREVATRISRRGPKLEMPLASRLSNDLTDFGVCPALKVEQSFNQRATAANSCRDGSMALRRPL